MSVLEQGFRGNKSMSFQWSAFSFLCGFASFLSGLCVKNAFPFGLSVTKFLGGVIFMAV